MSFRGNNRFLYNTDAYGGDLYNPHYQEGTSLPPPGTSALEKEDGDFLALETSASDFILLEN